MSSRQGQRPIRALDLFCGAGGSSWGAHKAGVKIVAAFDLWPLAGQVHAANFPDTEFIEGRLENIDVEALAKRLGAIDMILASPECTNHSPAKGGAERCEVSKNTAFEVLRFARVFKPRWIVIENVVNMKTWNRYSEFHSGLQELGYHITEQKLNAADFGVPQSRRRLFLLCDLKEKPSPLQKPDIPRQAIKHTLELNGKYKWTPLDNGKRAAATLERAKRGRAHVKRSPFLLVYYGSDGAGGWQRLDKPLRTITTLDRFAIVKKQNGSDVMRMLQPDELQAAMGMSGMTIEAGSRRERIKLLGNAVCPPVMKAVIRQLTKQAVVLDSKGVD